MDIAEKMAADIALAMDGGEWKDGKWYSKFHRDAWIKAVKPYANEIERLRKALRYILTHCESDSPPNAKALILFVNNALKEGE